MSHIYCIMVQTAPHSAPSAHTSRSNCQGLTLPPLLTTTIDTTYCDVVLIVFDETSQFILCNTSSGGV